MLRRRASVDWGRGLMALLLACCARSPDLLLQTSACGPLFPLIYVQAGYPQGWALLLLSFLSGAPHVSQPLPAGHKVRGRGVAAGDCPGAVKQRALAYSFTCTPCHPFLDEQLVADAPLHARCVLTLPPAPVPSPNLCAQHTATACLCLSNHFRVEQAPPGSGGEGAAGTSFALLLSA